MDLCLLKYNCSEAYTGDESGRKGWTGMILWVLHTFRNIFNEDIFDVRDFAVCLNEKIGADILVVPAENGKEDKQMRMSFFVKGV